MENRRNFSSKLGVVFAAAGSAVGLGNVWRFPTEVGNNGGAAFILVYLFCVVLIGMSVMLSEFLIGRHTHANTVSAFAQLAPGRWWRIGGVEGVFVAFLIFSYYIIISGWTLYYMVESLMGHLLAKQDYTVFFESFVSHPWKPILYAAVFMLVTHLVIVRGVRSGIERFSKVMMPMLLLIIGILVVCSFSMPGSSQGLTFLLRPDFSRITGSVVLSAMGQAFFSLSVGIGCLITYASYFGKETQLVPSAFHVCLIDTLVAVLSGFVIFPTVFSVPGMSPDAGPGLVFITLPNVFNAAFAHAPVLNYVFSALFYLLLLLAALTSSISMNEIATAFIHENYHVSRQWSTVIVTSIAVVLGTACSLSFGLWKDVTVFGMGFFDFFDYVTAKFMMPLGGILITVFVGWYLDRRLALSQLTCGGNAWNRSARVLLFLIRWVAPVGVGMVFLNELLS